MKPQENTNAYIPMLLVGPIQSWGSQTDFDIRHTDTIPTRSALIGIICAALGITREDTQGLANIATQTEFEYVEYLEDQNNPHLRDFQTVSKIRPTRSYKYLKDEDLRKALTIRYYVTNKTHAVIVKTNPTIAPIIAAALKNPKWGGTLGRKNCVPSWKINDGKFFSTIDEAENEIKTQLQKRERAKDPTTQQNENRKMGRNPLTTKEPNRQDYPIDFKKRKFKH